MRFFAILPGKPLVGAAPGGIPIWIFITALLSLLQVPLAPAVFAQAPAASAAPAVTLPAKFRNAPADAVESSTPDASLGEPALARLIALSRTHSPARAQAEARISNARRSFSGGDIEQRMHAAELVRLDLQLAEELAHAWFDRRAAETKLGIAHVLDTLGAQGLALVNQRLAAGLATQTDLDRMNEAAIKARALAVRATQERAAADARIAALTGENAAEPAPISTPLPIPASGLAPAPASGLAPAPLAYAIRSALPSFLLERPEVRAARVRLEARDASAAELAAFYREAVIKALEETETAYAAAVSARAQRTAAAEQATAAERQNTAVLAQLEAGRLGRVQHIDAQIVAQDARLRVVEAENAYAKALATLDRNLGR